MKWLKITLWGLSLLIGTGVILTVRFGEYNWVRDIWAYLGLASTLLVAITFSLGLRQKLKG